MFVLVGDVVFLGVFDSGMKSAPPGLQCPDAGPGESSTDGDIVDRRTYMEIDSDHTRHIESIELNQCFEYFQIYRNGKRNLTSYLDNVAVPGLSFGLIFVFLLNCFFYFLLFVSVVVVVAAAVTVAD